MGILHVTDVEVTDTERYELAVSFDDGTRRRVQLDTLLTGCFESLREPERFAEVYVIAPGMSTWAMAAKPEGAPREDAMQLGPAPEALKEAPVEELPRDPAAARA